ncbi:hypothetical protein PYJP_02330 [Pyrofollis japonicus]|nr:hypothetical protein PYJP_02330 [Pyrofollis japonicus]
MPRLENNSIRVKQAQWDRIDMLTRLSEAKDRKTNPQVHGVNNITPHASALTSLGEEQ